MYISRGLVGDVEVWNSTHKKSYAYSSFVTLYDTLYPLLRSWYEVGSTGFVTEFVVEDSADENIFLKSYWLERFYSFQIRHLCPYIFQC